MIYIYYIFPHGLHYFLDDDKLYKTSDFKTLDIVNTLGEDENVTIIIKDQNKKNKKTNKKEYFKKIVKTSNMIDDFYEFDDNTNKFINEFNNLKNKDYYKDESFWINDNKFKRLHMIIKDNNKYGVLSFFDYNGICYFYFCTDERHSPKESSIDQLPEIKDKIKYILKKEDLVIKSKDFNANQLREISNMIDYNYGLFKEVLHE